MSVEGSGSDPAQPLLRLKGSGLMSNEWRPSELHVFEDRVEEHNPGFLKRRSIQTIRYEQVAQVALQRGLMSSTLVVESRGGGTITVKKLSPKAADYAKQVIDDRVAAASRPQPSAAALQASTVDEIKRLAELRDQGILTEDEFTAGKRKLLGL